MIKMKEKIMILMLATLLLTSSITINGLAGTAPKLQADKPPQLEIQSPSQVIEGENFQITITCKNKPIANAKVTVGWMSGSIYYYSNSNGTVFLTAPQVNNNTQFFITASKTLYQSKTVWITVTDTPKLEIIVQPTVLEGEDFPVFVFTNQTGEPVQDAIVTFVNESFITDYNGSCMLTAPEVQYSTWTNFSINTSKQGFLPDSESISVIDSSYQLIIWAPSFVDESEYFGILVTAGNETASGTLVTITAGNQTFYANYTDYSGFLFAYIEGIDFITNMTITASKSSYVTGTKSLTVFPYQTIQQLQIFAPSSVDENEMFLVNISIDNMSIPNAFVSFNGETKQTNFNGTVTFIAPDVNITHDFLIVAFKYGYMNGSTTITVINIDQLQPYLVYVDDDYNMNTSGWGYDHFDNIQDGIDAVSNLGMIYVFNGHYYENVVVYKSIYILGVGGNVIVDGCNAGDIFVLTNDNICINGFIILNSGIGHSGISTIGNYSGYSNFNYITDNTISNCTFGVNLQYSSFTIVNNTYFVMNDVAIFLFSSHNNTIRYNHMINNHEGITVYDSYGNLIFENKVEYGDEGICLWYSHGNQVYHNSIAYNFIRMCYDTETTNVWNDGYPSGGNYWSNYNGTDYYHGPNQNIPGADGIGDTPYIIPDGINMDQYPLMDPLRVTFSLPFSSKILNKK